MRASPGSIRNSGCHCTPRQKRRPVASMPSTTPSGAVAFTAACAPGAATAWWWAEFTAIVAAPTMRASRVPGAMLTLWPGWSRGLGCSCSNAFGTLSGMCWISVPPSATASSCWPPQMPSTGMSRARAPCSSANSASVRRCLSVTVGWVSAAP